MRSPRSPRALLGRGGSPGTGAGAKRRFSPRTGATMGVWGTAGVSSYEWAFRPPTNGPRSQSLIPAPPAPAPVFAAARGATVLGRCRNLCHRLDTQIYRSRSWGCSCARKASSSPYNLALYNGRWPVCQAKATLRSAASVRLSNRLNGLKTSRTCFSEMPTDSCRSICSVMPFS